MLKENEKDEKIIIKCYKFYYEDFTIYFPVGGLDIKTNQEPDYSAPERTVRVHSPYHVTKKRRALGTRIVRVLLVNSNFKF